METQTNYNKRLTERINTIILNQLRRSDDEKIALENSSIEISNMIEYMINSMHR